MTIANRNAYFLFAPDTGNKGRSLSFWKFQRDQFWSEDKEKLKWQRKKRKDTDGKQNMNALGNLLLYNKGYLFGIKRDRFFFIVEIIRDLDTVQAAKTDSL